MLFIAAVYNPPKPRYTQDDFIDAIVQDIEFVQAINCNAQIVVAGDVNGLNHDLFTSETGLVYLPSPPTHGPNTLDKFFASIPNAYHTRVIDSLVKTKHKLVYISDSAPAPNHPSTKTIKKITLYDHRELHLNNLRPMIYFNIPSFDHNDSVQQMYSSLTSTIYDSLNYCIPRKTVRMSSSDPPFMTPLIKSLLQRRCALRLSNRIDEAQLLDVKLTNLIQLGYSTECSNLDSAPVKKLWSAIKRPQNLVPIASAVSLLKHSRTTLAAPPSTLAIPTIFS